MRRPLIVLLAVCALVAAPAVTALPTPPLAASPNVELVMSIPGSAAGMVFKGNYAYVTGWGGLTVLDISNPALPVPAGTLPLPHFENEDVDLCGDTLLISNDGSIPYGVLYVIDISNPNVPSLASVFDLGDTGAGHISNFVKADCSQVWVDGGSRVQVIDLTDPENPTSLGTFDSRASMSDAFDVTHDTELDSTGTLWSVGGGGNAGYRLTDNPLKPRLVARTDRFGVNRDFGDGTYNDFIHHNSQRRGDVLLVTEEDYVDTDQEQPGSCNGQGRFQTWQIRPINKGPMHNLDTWQTELNGFLAGGGAEDSKAPVTANCSSHWFDEKDGIVAVGWYEQGVRFLDVTRPGNIRQVGYYLPVDGSTWAAYWSPTDPNGEIVYTADVTRGVDVLRIKGGGNDPGTATVKAPILDSWFGTPTPTSTDYKPSASFGSACLLKLD